MEIKFKPGDRVKFVPQVGSYERHEYWRRGEFAVVKDLSDIPTIEFEDASRSYAPHITAALQEDLVRA